MRVYYLTASLKNGDYMLSKLLLITLSLVSSSALFAMYGDNNPKKSLWEIFSEGFQETEYQKILREEREGREREPFRQYIQHMSPQEIADKLEQHSASQQKSTSSTPTPKNEVKSTTQPSTLKEYAAKSKEQKTGLAASKSETKSTTQSSALKEKIEKSKEQKTDLASSKSEAKSTTQSSTLREQSAKEHEQKAELATSKSETKNTPPSSSIIDMIHQKFGSPSSNSAIANVVHANKSTTGTTFPILIKGPDGKTTLKAVQVVAHKDTSAVVCLHKQSVTVDGKTVIPNSKDQVTKVPVIALVDKTERGQELRDKMDANRQASESNPKPKEPEQKPEIKAKDLTIPRDETKREPTDLFQEQADKFAEGQQQLTNITQGHFESGQVSVDVNPFALLFQPLRYLVGRLRLEVPEGISRWDDAALGYQEFAKNIQGSR